MKKNKKSETHVSDFVPYLIAATAMVAGILVGAFSALRLSGEDINSYAQSITSSALETQSMNECFITALTQNVKTAAVFWFLGITVVGSIPLVAATYYKGYAVGFTVSFLIINYKLAGLIAALAGVLPHSIIYIPVYVFLAGLGMRFSCKLLYDRGNIKSKFLSYSIRVILLLAVLLVGAAVEGYISSRLFKMAIGFAVK